MSVRRTTRSPQETMQLAMQLAPCLAGGGLVALEGALGSGKTCFVRGLAAGLGLDPDDVASPTFVLCRRYGRPGSVTLYHVDAFRITGPDDLETIGWDELLEGGDAVVAVEWSGRIAWALPPQGAPQRVDIRFDHGGDEIRHLELTGPAEVEAAWSAGPGSPCPICGRPAPPNAPSFPFCTERCRLVDLGLWMGERYRV